MNPDKIQYPAYTTHNTGTHARNNTPTFTFATRHNNGKKSVHKCDGGKGKDGDKKDNGGKSKSGDLGGKSKSGDLGDYGYGYDGDLSKGKSDGDKSKAGDKKDSGDKGKGTSGKKGWVCKDGYWSVLCF